MTNRIPPQPIGSEIKTFYPNTANLTKAQKRNLDLFTSRDIDGKVTDPFEQLKLNALQNGDKVKIQLKKPDTNNIEWYGDKGTIETYKTTKNYEQKITYNFTKDRNGDVMLENCEALYRTKVFMLNRYDTLEETYIDNDGNLSIDEHSTIIKHISEDETNLLETTVRVDKGFDGIPDYQFKIDHTNGNTRHWSFDKDKGIAGEFKELE